MSTTDEQRLREALQRLCKFFPTGQNMADARYSKGEIELANAAYKGARAALSLPPTPSPDPREAYGALLYAVACAEDAGRSGAREVRAESGVAYEAAEKAIAALAAPPTPAEPPVPVAWLWRKGADRGLTVCETVPRPVNAFPVYAAVREPAAPVDARDALTKRITTYLASGGLFNPEMASHVPVRDLLIDCRAAITRQPAIGEKS